MKKALWVTCLIGLAAFLGLGNPRAYAQAEIDPDHYDTREPEPTPQPKTHAASQDGKMHYEGKFVLPYKLQCNRGSLSPGKYLIAVDFEGEAAHVTVTRKGHSTIIEGITKKQRTNRGRSVLVVERRGATRQLSVIQLAQLDLAFTPTLGLEQPANGKRKKPREIPLTSVGSREMDHD